MDDPTDVAPAVTEPVVEALELSSWTERITAARLAQTAWARRSVSERVKKLRRFAALVAHRVDELAETVALPQRTPRETIASEIVPLADAAQYLVKNADRILRPRWEGRSGRPLWALNVSVETRHQPWGVVLIVGPCNYPLLLPGVQMLQALAAGNAVLIKPGRDSSASAQTLRMLFVEAGGDAALVQILPEDIDSVSGALEAGVDHVVMTGSTTSGRAVLRLAAETLTPGTMELSGCDAVLIQHSADIELAARAISFGLVFNNSATCMAPRRIFLHRERKDDLLNALNRQAADWRPKPVEAAASERARSVVDRAVAAGATIALGSIPSDELWSPVVVADVTPAMELARADVFAPVTSLIIVDDDAHALELVGACPYSLGASVFGEPRAAAALARKIPAGCVVVNDLIAPTVDPRVSFPAWNGSGYGVTRGPEGLLQMTRVNVIVEQRGNWRPHLDPQGEPPMDLLRGLLNWSHGHSLGQRIRGLTQLARAMWRSSSKR